MLYPRDAKGQPTLLIQIRSNERVELIRGLALFVEHFAWRYDIGIWLQGVNMLIGEIAVS